VSDRLTMLVIVGTSKDAHSLRSQVGIGSESGCLFGQFDRILGFQIQKQEGKMKNQKE